MGDLYYQNIIKVTYDEKSNVVTGIYIYDESFRVKFYIKIKEMAHDEGDRYKVTSFPYLANEYSDNNKKYFQDLPQNIKALVPLNKKRFVINLFGENYYLGYTGDID